MIDRAETPPTAEIRPCLAELFRTCVYPSSLPLHIEEVLVEACNDGRKGDSPDNEVSLEDEGRKAYRLYLSDGVLVVQALLQDRLVALIDLEQVVVGSTLVLRRFRIERARRVNGRGEVVFLGIADCDIVPAGQRMLQGGNKKRSVSEGLGTESEEGKMPVKRIKLDASSVGSSCEASKACRRGVGSTSSAQDSDCDDFETTTFDPSTLDKKRKALRELNTNGSLENQKTPTLLYGNNDRQPIRSDTTHKSTPSSRPTANQPNSSPKPAHHKLTSQPYNNNDHHHRPAPPPTAGISFPVPPPLAATDPPYHTLLSLLNPAPAHQPSSSSSLPKSFAVTLFVIPSWLSPSLLHAPRSPFPPKRHLKLHDPTISSRVAGVTLAVYCDAANFRPRLGSPVLVSGVVVQRLHNYHSSSEGGNEVVLNAYEKLMKMEGVGGEVGRWFEDDERVLEGLGWDVKGLRGWWEGRERRRREGRGL